MKFFPFLILLTSFTLVSCKTVSPLGGKRLDPSQKKECMLACNTLNMKMGAFVLISGRSGCVCEPRSKKVRSASTSLAPLGGALAAIDDEQQSIMFATTQQAFYY